MRLCHIVMQDPVTSMGFRWLVFFPFEESTVRLWLAFSAFSRKSPGILLCCSIERALELFGKGLDGVEECMGATVPARDSCDGFDALSVTLLSSMNNF